MPELWAGDIGWLGAGWAFAWMLGALIRLADGAPSRAAPDTRGPKSRCGGRPRASHTASQTRPPRDGGRFALALLPAMPLALIGATTTGAAHAIAVAAAGVLCGAWLARRYRRPARPQLIAVAGCVAGAAVVAGGFAAHLLRPQHGVLERGALDVAVSLGAWMLAASACAAFVEFTRERRGKRARRHTAHLAAAQPAFGERTVHGLAITLCVALAYGFAAAGASAQFRLAALIASCGLAAALGVRVMAGGFAATRAAPVARWRAVGVRPGHDRSDARVDLLGIPDELLVAACGGETFDAACLFPPGADGHNGRGGPRDEVPAPTLPRRQRDRYGSAGRYGGGRAHR